MRSLTGDGPDGVREKSTQDAEFLRTQYQLPQSPLDNSTIVPEALI
jgi:hypothetical protein